MLKIIANNKKSLYELIKALPEYYNIKKKVNIDSNKYNKIKKKLIDYYDGKVPDKEQELLKLSGIGRKCMGIVMCYGFVKNSHLPVDTHVHKLTNRLGWVKTKTPEKTEQELIKIIPRKYWHDLNNLLVAHGQNICVPVSPYCSKCSIRKYCPRINVNKSR